MAQTDESIRGYLSEKLGDSLRGGLTAEDIAEVNSSVKSLKCLVSSQRSQLEQHVALEEFDSVLKERKAQFVDVDETQSLADDSQLLRMKGVSPSVAVETSLQRISVSNQKDLIWRSVFAEEAKRQAIQIEQKPEGQRGLLYGYTIGLKDMIDKVGYRPGWGAKLPVMEHEAQEDAVILKRLELADGVIMGTLHMAEFALSPTGFNEWHGLGRSPVNEDYISGGSSSGSGMAVGAGHVVAAIGSDTGGSVRLPAACCSVVGLKPTQGLVSVEGVMPLSPSLDCIGPLARNVSDCANVFLALAASDNLNISSNKFSIENCDGADFVVAIPVFPQNAPLSKRMRSELRLVEDKLKDLGCTLIEVPFPDLEKFGMLSTVLLSVEATSYHHDRIQINPELFGRQVLRRLVRGLGLSGLDYYDALRLRGPLLREFLDVNLQGAQALLLPTLPDTPPLVSRTINREQAVLEKEFSALSWWTRGINYLGLPSLSMPVSLTETEFPLSIQLVGAPYGERDILCIAYLLERHLGLSISE